MCFQLFCRANLLVIFIHCNYVVHQSFQGKHQQDRETKASKNFVQVFSFAMAKSNLCNRMSKSAAVVIYLKCNLLECYLWWLLVRTGQGGVAMG